MEKEILDTIEEKRKDYEKSLIDAKNILSKQAEILQSKEIIINSIISLLQIGFFKSIDNIKEFLNLNFIKELIGEKFKEFEDEMLSFPTEFFNKKVIENVTKSKYTLYIRKNKSNSLSLVDKIPNYPYHLKFKERILFIIKNLGEIPAKRIMEQIKLEQTKYPKNLYNISYLYLEMLFNEKRISKRKIGKITHYSIENSI